MNEERTDDFIKVAVRVRPEIAKSDEQNSHGSNCVAVRLGEPTLDVRHPIFPTRPYVYDSVFDQDIAQESVFMKLGKSIVGNCIAGYNATIFAYGQTGSGKTFTMMGPGFEESADLFGEENRVSWGLIPRTVEHLLIMLETKRDQVGDATFEFLCKCSFVELYKEDIFDLLSSNSAKLSIRIDIKNGVYIDGAVQEYVSNLDDVLQLMKTGFKKRSVAATGMNRESSRSHAIFILEVETKEVDGDIVMHKVSRLNLVDLAGSERQGDAQTNSERLAEASKINQSLVVLGRVIRRLCHRHNVYKPSYRDSKLTHLLQDSLGGNARTVVVATVRPDSKFYAETLATLEFAQNVKKVRNRAIVNEDVCGENVEAMEREVKRLRREVDSGQTLRRQLDEALNYAVQLEKQSCKVDDQLDDWKKYATELQIKIRTLESSIKFRNQTIRSLSGTLQQQGITGANITSFLRELEMDADCGTICSGKEYGPLTAANSISVKEEVEREQRRNSLALLFRPSDQHSLAISAADSGQCSALNQAQLQLEICRLNDRISELDGENKGLRSDLNDKDERISNMQMMIKQIEESAQEVELRKEKHQAIHDASIFKTPMAEPGLRRSRRVTERKELESSVKKERRLTRFNPGSGTSEAGSPTHSRILPTFHTPQSSSLNQSESTRNPLMVEMENLEKKLAEEERLRMKADILANRLYQLVDESDRQLALVQSEAAENEARLGVSLNQLQQRDQSRVQAMQELKEDFADMQNRLKRVQYEKDDLEKKLEDVETESMRLTDMYELRRKQLDDVCRNNDNLLGENASLKNNFEAVQVELFDKEKEYNLLKSAHLKLSADNGHLIAEVNGLRIQLEQEKKVTNELKIWNENEMEANVRVVGHQNDRQKIQYIEKLRTENANIKDKYLKLQRQSERRQTNNSSIKSAAARISSTTDDTCKENNRPTAR